MHYTELEDFPSDPPGAFFVDYKSTSPGELRYKHWFCGPQEHPGAWCPNCHRALIAMLSLDVSDPRLNIRHDGLRTLPLLYCWTCNVSQNAFFYRIHAPDRIELIEFLDGDQGDDFPYSNYPAFFPGAAVDLQPMPSHIQDAIRSFNKDRGQAPEIVEFAQYYDCHHQIGGESFMWQSFSEMRCPACTNLMPFLASVADDNQDPRGFTDNCGVQVLFYYCRDCQIVGAHNECD